MMYTRCTHLCILMLKCKEPTEACSHFVLGINCKVNGRWSPRHSLRQSAHFKQNTTMLDILQSQITAK